jgi:hypothetical protein
MKRLEGVLTVIKSIAYLLVGAFTILTYAKQDYIFGEIAKLSAPYNEVYIKSSVESLIPAAMIAALKQDSIKVYITEEQWAELDTKLYKNKTEILDAIPDVSKRVMHDFLIVERELHNPATGETFYLKGILLGLRPDGSDDWIWRISENKNNL